MEKGDGCGEQQPRQIFDGISYRLLGFDIPALEQLYASDIEMRGGKAATRLTKENCTHLIINSDTIEYDDRFCKKAREEKIIVVNQHWVEDSTLGSELANPGKVLYQPVKKLDGISGFLQVHICTSGYSENMCAELRTLADLAGATFYEKWDDKATHLICYKFEGDDYRRAKKCKIPVVNENWIEACLIQWRIVPVENYNISGWELEQQQVHAKGTRQELGSQADKQFSRMKRECSTKQNFGVFSPRNIREMKGSTFRDADNSFSPNNSTPEMKKACITSQYYTPSSKNCLIDASRKAFSTGAKRVKVQLECNSTLKCKRALDYSSIGENTETTLHDYAKYGLIQDVQIPYSRSTRKMAKEGIKLILLNAYEEVLDLHRKDKSLKGLFNPQNFCISLQNKKVSLQDLEVLPYSKGDSEIDKARFADMTKAIFGATIPAEITGWLDCIAAGDPDNVLRRHVNMLHSSNVFGEFCIMYHSLLKLQANDEVRYNKLLWSLRQYDSWQSRKFNWAVLKDNFSYRDPSANGYERNVFGLCKLIRNCWAHPARLYPEFLMAILLDEHPELLSELQVALYEAGCLPHLDVQN